MRQWEEILTEADRVLLERTGLKVEQPFGARPALLIIDVTRSFIGSERRPVLDSVEEYKLSCGEAGWVALGDIKTLLEACRGKNIPVIFTTVDPVMRTFLPGSIKGVSTTERADFAAQDIPESIAPLPRELIIRKTKASAFFGTPLLAYLLQLKTDTLLIAGTTTSGCVRATVVDAFSHGFRCFVVEECTFDRFELSHLVSLFDMNLKYADVITLGKALDYVARIGS